MTHNVATFILFVIFAFHASASDLHFHDDGTFKIVQFADLHYGEGENVLWGPMQDYNSTRVMRNILTAEKPDLVIFSGDQITGNNIQSNATAYWSQVVEVCVQMNVPWAMILGNHDDMPFQNTRLSITTRRQLLEFDRSFALSHSGCDDTSLHGVTNYVLPIFPPASSSTPALLLYMFDSGGGTLPEVIQPDQVQWYLNSSAAWQAKTGTVLPALAFFHIPLQEYTYHPATCVGMNQDGITPQIQNTGLFHAFLNRTDVRWTFCGHDHGNDWCCNVSGIQLCYGRHSGYGGYGDWDRGSRVIQLSLSKDSTVNVKTWIRLEDGTVVPQR
eukprot:TRINITY_DN15111_c0_g1_i1.p1 TRINITY_DN15111_c0_g1~~TRINITY_DN15111_c0_g1_i1.p1  ORF type:complete len:329 (+),score=41.56 TRINITY_DN15111_c0_g1_i1:62-1048(+)